MKSAFKKDKTGKRGNGWITILNTMIGGGHTEKGTLEQTLTQGGVSCAHG